MNNYINNFILDKNTFKLIENLKGEFDPLNSTNEITEKSLLVKIIDKYDVRSSSTGKQYRFGEVEITFYSRVQKEYLNEFKLKNWTLKKIIFKYDSYARINQYPIIEDSNEIFKETPSQIFDIFQDFQKYIIDCLNYLKLLSNFSNYEEFELFEKKINHFNNSRYSIKSDNFFCDKTKESIFGFLELIFFNQLNGFFSKNTEKSTCSTFIIGGSGTGKTFLANFITSYLTQLKICTSPELIEYKNSQVLGNDSSDTIKSITSFFEKNENRVVLINRISKSIFIETAYFEILYDFIDSNRGVVVFEGDKKEFEEFLILQPRFMSLNLNLVELSDFSDDHIKFLITETLKESGISVKNLPIEYINEIFVLFRNSNFVGLQNFYLVKHLINKILSNHVNNLLSEKIFPIEKLKVIDFKHA
ncbi:hypothetical protein [Aquiflexum sp.]|uniref:hypothetical protein n=1 Tax=Aquiflexum sp. TaxID=1872584 RepID=UPI003594791B